MNTRASKPRWGASGGAKLGSHNPISNVDQTIRPFDQTVRSSKHLKSRRYHESSRELTIGSSSPQYKQQTLGFSRRSQPSHQPSVNEPWTQRLPCEEPKDDLAPQPALRLSELATKPPETQTQSSQQVIKPSVKVPPRLSSQRCSVKSTNTDADQPQIELPPARRREIVSSISKSVKDIMMSTLPGDSNSLQWKLKQHKKNITYYVDKTSDQRRLCCVSHTHATVAEIMSLFLPTDQDAVLRNNKLLHNNIIDTKTLVTLRSPTKERSMNSIYMQCSSFQTSRSSSIQKTYAIVATDMIRQSDGSTIGYCLSNSINSDEILTPTSLELSTSFCSGFFFRHPGREDKTKDSTQGPTKIVYIVGMKDGTWASKLTSRLVMEKHGSVVEHLCSHFRQKYMDPSKFVMKMQWESKGDAKSCKRCDKTFQLLSNRVNCHACGHVVCRSCVLKEKIKLHIVGLVSVYFCYCCLSEAGLPTPASAQKTQGLKQMLLQSGTTNTLRQSITVAYFDAGDDSDDDDDDTGEWAITTMGIPLRPTRMAAFV